MNPYNNNPFEMIPASEHSRSEADANRLLADATKCEVTRQCPICGKASTVTVKTGDYLCWKLRGDLIQNAFPYLTADEREILQTGICSDCWPSEE